MKQRLPEPELVREVLPKHLLDRALNVVVFGPGSGEACLVRLPDGRVGVVDGCRERDDPVALLVEHLAEASPDPDTFRLAFVALTHPHADHYAGLGRLLERYRGRIDQVWRNGYSDRYAEQLLAYVKAAGDGKGLLPDERAIHALRRVLRESARARTAHGAKMQWLVAGKDLLHDSCLSIRACGPADGDMDDAAQDLTRAIQKLANGEALGRPHDPNQASGAIVIRWGKAGVLLAGDLLQGDGPYSGWRNAREQLDGAIQVVNVAHHASEGAHDATLWQTMCPDLAIVTPFKSAVGTLPPQPKMIATLARSSAVVLTAPPTWADEAVKHGLRWGASAGTPRPSLVGRNHALDLVASPGHLDRHNAVAVALDHDGRVLRLVLAGQASMVEAYSATR